MVREGKGKRKRKETAGFASPKPNSSPSQVPGQHDSAIIEQALIRQMTRHTVVQPEQRSPSNAHPCQPALMEVPGPNSTPRPAECQVLSDAALIRLPIDHASPLQRLLLAGIHPRFPWLGGGAHRPYQRDRHPHVARFLLRYGPRLAARDHRDHQVGTH